MGKHIKYFNGQLMEEIDGDNDLFTRWDDNGDVVEQRPLTLEETDSVHDTTIPESIYDRVSKLESKTDKTDLLADLLVGKGLVTKEEVDPIKIVLMDVPLGDV